MLCKKTVGFWKVGFMAISSMLLAHVSGCSDTPPVETQMIEEDGEEEMIEVCQELYAKAAEESKLADLEVIRSIVNWFGENGYAAVDSRNQIDMTEKEQVIRFCKKVDAKEEDELTIIEVTSLGGFVKYDLQTKDGKVDVVRNYYEYENGKMQKVVTGSYTTDYWNYTEDGYLMFSGIWFSEELYVLTMSRVEEYSAFRVQPLDEKCRELNRQYLLPVSYEQNNMFLVEWSEKDFGNLNFYDLYDIFYPKENAQFSPYTADDNLGVGAVYRIPKDEFESVIMSYFNISSETLQSKTIYHPEDATYEYKPRGFYEVEYPEYPHSEVVEYTENNDGTITLTVNVVFPYEGNSKVYAHEVVVRPMEGGGVQYVSNRIIPSEYNNDETWHTPRLTEEEWEEMYGCKKEDTGESVIGKDTKGYDLPVEDSQREKAEADCKYVMEMLSEIYRLADKGEASNAVISDKTIIQMKEVIKGKGYPVTSSERYAAMENYEEMEAFLEFCMEGKAGAIVMYEVYSKGDIGRMEYIFDGSDMYVLALNAIRNKNNQPEITYLSYTRIKEWKYTDKGWFCYELCVPEYPEVTEVVDGSSLVRVNPLPDKCRELSEKCVLPLGYQGNNLLCSNWDAKTLKGLDYNGMYEYLHAIKYEEQFNPESYSNGIPAEKFESVIMEYLPVTAEQIREWAVFDDEYGTYAWTRLGCMNYTPTFFGTSLPEVIHVEENADGTVTLTVDAVCEIILCNDAVITHELTVRFLEDGSFQYLGNKILNNGIQDIPEYQYRFGNKTVDELIE